MIFFSSFWLTNVDGVDDGGVGVDVDRGAGAAVVVIVVADAAVDVDVIIAWLLSWFLSLVASSLLIYSFLKVIDEGKEMGVVRGVGVGEAQWSRSWSPPIGIVLVDILFDLVSQPTKEDKQNKRVTKNHVQAHKAFLETVFSDGGMAERSKAVRSGRIPKGRGFEPHFRQMFIAPALGCNFGWVMCEMFIIG